MSRVLQAQKIHSDLCEIAVKFARSLYDAGMGSVYSEPSLGSNSDTFHFSVGPTTHGMSRSVSLPLSMLDGWTDEELEKLAKEQKEKWDEERTRNTCKTCGHQKFQQEGWFYV